MKSLYISIVLFLVVIIFLCGNFIYANRFIDKTSGILESIPEKAEEYVNMSNREKENIKKKLKTIKQDWESMENYVCSCLEHKTGREFAEVFLSAYSFYESSEYPEFLSLIEQAKDTLKHIKYDEGINLGNIL